MRVSTTGGARLLALAACFLPSSLAAGAWNRSSAFIPGRYIVEFEDETTSSHTFFSALSENAIAATPLITLDYSLFKGASFNLHDIGNEKDNVQKILALPSVKSVQAVRSYPLPHSSGYASNQFPPLSSAAAAAQASLDTTPDTFTTHVMTGVDKLHADGLSGDRLKVAIVDTGIDYTHPALGGCFGEGCKVAFGKDLVGDAYTGTNTPVPGDDPMDCVGHGTHVAGIIAANSAAPSFTGVAPNATLGIYRVFGCHGSAADDVLIQAFMMAYEDGADVITASIGVASGWSEEPWAVAVSRIVEAGVPCTVAAGNDGQSGLFIASAASTGHGVTAVASIDNVVTPSLFKNASWSAGNETAKPFGWIPYIPADIPNGTYPVFDILQGNNDTTIVCLDNFTIPKIPGKIALVPWVGGCSVGSGMAEMVAAAGSKYLMWYTDTPVAGITNGTGYGVDSFGMVSYDVAAQWTKLLAAGTQVSLNMINPSYENYYAVSPANNVTGGYLSYYTSWGPTYEAEVKPQIAAPGGSILSTYPLKLGGYKIESGTSMATPFVAGSIALILEARGKLDPATINNLLSASAEAKSFNDGESTYDYLAPVAQQGAGLLNVYDAVHTVGLLNISSISFNDTDHFIKSVSFEIKNTGKESITYDIGYVSTGTAYTLPSDGSSIPATFSPGSSNLEVVPSSAKLSLSSDSVTVKAGESATIQVTATLPTDLTASRIPIYGGYITLNSTTETLSLPYLGVASKLNDAAIFDTKDNMTYISQYFDSSAIPENFAFTLPPPNSTDEELYKYDFPVPFSINTFGTRVLRLDLVPTSSNNTFKTTEVLGEKIVGSIDPFPLYEQGRGSWHTFWYGNLSDGSYAPAGDYNILFRALKVFGDKNVAGDYEIVKSVNFSISYASSNTTTTSTRRSTGFKA